MNARKLVIDCDPGIDDSLALMLAAASKELDLVGITTVRDVYKRQFTRCSFKASQQAAIPSGQFGELLATRFCFASCSLRPGALPSVAICV